MMQPAPPQHLRFCCLRCPYRSLDLAHLVSHVLDVHAYQVECALKGPLLDYGEQNDA